MLGKAVVSKDRLWLIMNNADDDDDDGDDTLDNLHATIWSASLHTE